MTKDDIRKAQNAIDTWRKEHPDVESRRKAFRKSIPKRVYASMAFEGEHVSLEMLEKHLKTLIAKRERKAD